jgi:glutathione S-transferase
MITVFGEGRGFRVVWLLEEMGIPYRLRPVDLLAGVEKDAEFLAVNPAGFIPAIQDGNVTMVESIAIMEYLMGRYGPTQLAPDPHDPAFPAYQQFLHLGEAGLAASIYFVVGARNYAPEAQRQNWSAGQAQEVFESRLGLVTRQLARSPYLAGETFTPDACCAIPFLYSPGGRYQFARFVARALPRTLSTNAFSPPILPTNCRTARRI